MLIKLQKNINDQNFIHLYEPSIFTNNFQLSYRIFNHQVQMYENQIDTCSSRLWIFVRLWKI